MTGSGAGWGEGSLPIVAEQPELDEHRFRVGVFGQVVEDFPERRDHRRAVQAEEGVDLLLQGERRHQGAVRILVPNFGQQRFGARVVGFSVEGEFKVVDDVVVAGIDQRLVRQLRQLRGEGLVKLFRVAAAVALAAILPALAMGRDKSADGLWENR